MSDRRRKYGRPTEAEYRAIIDSPAFTSEERAAVDLMRCELTARGITAEPMRTKLACEFAEVLLARHSERRV